MAQGHRYNKRTESLPSSLPNALMFGNGQISQEDNPNYLVYKKVSRQFCLKVRFKLLIIYEPRHVISNNVAFLQV